MWSNDGWPARRSRLWFSRSARDAAPLSFDPASPSCLTAGRAWRSSSRWTPWHERRPRSTRRRREEKLDLSQGRRGFGFADNLLSPSAGRPPLAQDRRHVSQHELSGTGRALTALPAANSRCLLNSANLRGRKLHRQNHLDTPSGSHLTRFSAACKSTFGPMVVLWFASGHPP